VERTVLAALRWPHAARRDQSHRATAERLLPRPRVRRDRPADRPDASLPADREDGKQARVVLGRLLAQAAEGRRPDTNVTVADVLARYLAVAELDPSTRATYAGYIRRTILPALGAMELRKVRGPLLDTFYARLRRCGDLTCTGRPFTEHRKFPDLIIESGDSRCAWRRACAAIRDAASSGQLALGEQLPSVRELAAQHGLPVAALRRAFEELAREGVITVRHGRRAIVSGGPSPPPMSRPQAGDAGHDCARAGCQPHRCRPISPKTIRQIHAIHADAFAAAGPGRRVHGRF
jgi:hypothetical protein